MNRAKKRTQKWENDIADAEEIFRQHSPKTSNGKLWDLYLKDHISVYDELWNAKLSKKWGREHFRVYRSKQKLSDGFFNYMKEDGPVRIGYGSAGFASSEKGELAVPTTAIARKCVQHFRTEFIDEYNTTKMCNKCGECLCKVVHEQTKGEPKKKKKHRKKKQKSKRNGKKKGRKDKQEEGKGKEKESKDEQEESKGKEKERKEKESKGKENENKDKQEEGEEKEIREIRGLRWCCSTKCRTFLNRDLNAALNILKCYKSGKERPNYLSREFKAEIPSEKSYRKVLKLRRQGD